MSGCVTNLFFEEQRNERYKSEGALLKNLKSKQKSRFEKQDSKSKRKCREHHQAINARAKKIFRYRAGIVEWRKNELEAIDRKTRKLTNHVQKFAPKGRCRQVLLEEEK